MGSCFLLVWKNLFQQREKKKTAVEIIEETVWEKEQAETGTTNNLPGQTRAGKAASFLPSATITRGCSSECSRGIFSSNLRGNATSGTIEVIGEQRGSRLVFPDPCGAALTGTPRAMLDTRSRSKSASFECVTWGVCVCVMLDAGRGDGDGIGKCRAGQRLYCHIFYLTLMLHQSTTVQR